MPRAVALGFEDGSIVLHAVDRADLERLIASVPPRDGDGWSAGFLTDLVRLSADLASAEAAEMEREWSDGDWRLLWDAALVVNGLLPGTEGNGAAAVVARLRWDHRLREEMEACAAMGIAHSEFLAWGEADRDKAMGFLAWRAIHCTCGTRQEEWDADPAAYEPTARTCPGCELVERYQEFIASQVPEDQRQGMKVWLTPRVPDPEEAET